MTDETSIGGSTPKTRLNQVNSQILGNSRSIKDLEGMLLNFLTNTEIFEVWIDSPEKDAEGKPIKVKKTITQDNQQMNIIQRNQVFSKINTEWSKKHSLFKDRYYLLQEVNRYKKENNIEGKFSDE